MKNWSNPEMKELNVSNTEHWQLTGTNVDGTWRDENSDQYYDTYSGGGENPFEQN